MKNIILLSFLFTVGFNIPLKAIAASCDKKEYTQINIIKHRVDTDMPNHLKGATITITQVDGKTSTVPAEKFKVVPRKQQFIVGQDKVTQTTLTCDTKDKNLIAAEVRKDYTELEVTSNGKTANVYSKKETVPGINYYRRDLIGDVGAGVGVDSNGVVKALIGLEF